MADLLRVVPGLSFVRGTGLFAPIDKDGVREKATGAGIVDGLTAALLTRQLLAPPP